MKKSEAIGLFNTINTMGSIASTKFSYAIIKNVEKLKDEFEAVKKIQQIKSPEHEEFETKRIQLCHEFAEKDEKGNPVLVGSNYKIKDQDAFDKMYSKLESNYSGVMEEINNKVKQINDILDEESDIELYKISIDDLPKELTPAQVKSLMPMIMEE